MQPWHGWGMRRGCPDIQLFHSPVTVWTEWWPKNPFSNLLRIIWYSFLCQNKILTQVSPSVRALQIAENISATLSLFGLYFTRRKYCKEMSSWAKGCLTVSLWARSSGCICWCWDLCCTPYDVLYQQVVALLMISLLLCRCIVRGLYVSWEYLEPHSLGCPSCWESPLLTLWATSSSKQTTTTSPLDSMVLSWHHISSSKACLPT